VAVALDAALGSNSTGALSGATSVVVTTSAAAASGTKVLAFMSWFNSSAGPMTVSGGGLTWASVGQANNGSDRFAIWAADAPSGLASSSSITASQQALGAGGLLVSVASFSGVGTVDTTAQSTGTTGSPYTSGATSNTTVGALFAGGTGNETATSTTSTPSNGAEIHDLWASGAQQGIATGWLAAAGTASQGITGSWVGAASTANTGLLAIYNPSASAPGILRRFPLGV
jgi:hypothetical protein